jgi:hypothetical protein
MVGPGNSNAGWTDGEKAFVIGYTDYCLHHGLEYQKAVAKGLITFSGRSVTYSTIQRQLVRALEGYDIETSVTKFLKQSFEIIDIAKLPDRVFRELNALRHDWGFADLRKDGATSQ